MWICFGDYCLAKYSGPSYKLEPAKEKQLSVLDGLSANRQTALKIIDDVRQRGDSAIVKYSKRFDRVSLSPDKFRVKNREIEEAYRKISLPFVKSIQRAIANIKH